MTEKRGGREEEEEALVITARAAAGTGTYNKVSVHLSVSRQLL